MDHLPLPQNPRIGRIAIPFLAESYDGGPFKAYPSRRGFSIEHRGDKPNFFNFVSNYEGSRNLESLLQTWLYFGLLCEFLGGPVDMTSFQRNESNNILLSSSLLEGLVGARTVHLADRFSSSEENAVHEWKNGIYDTLIEARHHTMMASSSLSEPHSPLSLICLANAALGEYLMNCLGDVIGRLGFETPVQQTWRLLGDFRADCGLSVETIMQQQNWCPAVLARLNNGHASKVSVLWYFANLSPPRAAEDHSSCTSEQCSLLQIDRNSYQTLHSSDECDCAFLGAQQASLAEIVGSGQLPLISVRRVPQTGAVSVHVEMYTGKQAFVAISHAWADGRGNPDANTLPTCTLCQIQDLVNRIPKSDPNSETPFWIDTLCVPRNPRSLFHEALKRLADPYANAAHVLVMDSYLRSQLVSQASFTETLARIAICGWQMRLWTFQEGRLAKSAWFAFQDDCINLVSGMEDWKKTFSRIPSTPSHLLELCMLLHHTSTWLDRELIDQELLTSVAMLRQSLRNRATSVRSDEALCLCTIAGFETRQIVDTDPKSRMCVFWNTISVIPASVAFSKARKKLTEKGYRWAPASFMGDLDLDEKQWVGPSAMLKSPPAVCVQSGLLVELPAWHFFANAESHDQAHRRALLRIFDTQPGSMDETIFLCDESGRWFFCTFEEPWHDVPKTFDPADQPVILMDHEQLFGEKAIRKPDDDYGSQGSQNGLLVSYKQDATKKCHVQVAAHRHLLLSMISQKRHEQLNLIKACADALLFKHSESLIKVLDDHEGMERLVEHLVREYIWENPGCLMLRVSKSIRLAERKPSHDKAVIKECVRDVKLFCQLGPWCMVRSDDRPATWCID